MAKVCSFFKFSDNTNENQNKLIEKLEGNILVILVVFVIMAFLSVKNIQSLIIDMLNINFTTALSVLSLTLSLVIFVGSFYYYCKYKPEKSISNVIRDIISGRIDGIYGIFGILFMLSMVSWFGDNIFSIEKVEGFIFALNSFLNIFSFGLIYLILYPDKKYKDKSELLPEARKVLIMALSYWGPYKERSDEIKEEMKKKLNEEKIDSNWELPIRAVLHHREKIEKVIFLATNKSGEEEHWNKFIETLRYVARERYNFDIDKIRIEKIEVDFNDHGEIMSALRQKIKEIKREYKDDEISVNISSGTSAVTMCLTIFALEDRRQIEYFTQNLGNTREISKLKKFDLSKDDAIAFLESYSL